MALAPTRYEFRLALSNVDRARELAESVIVAPSICTTGVPTLLSISVITRVESVSKAKRARSYMTCTLAMYWAGLAGSAGGLALTLGFGLLAQPRDS